MCQVRTNKGIFTPGLSQPPGINQGFKDFMPNHPKLNKNKEFTDNTSMSMVN
jgi:hypothetical protein